MISHSLKLSHTFADEKFYLKNYVVNEKRVDNVTTTKFYDLVAKKVTMIVKKIATKNPSSTSNKGNIASSKRNKTLGLRYVSKVKKEDNHSSDT